MINKKPLSVIIGAGRGLGCSLATALTVQGYQVVCINRSQATNADNDIIGIQLDGANEMAISAALNDVIEKYGVPSVLIHNTAQLYINSFAETSVDQFEKAWRSMVLSAFNAMKIIVPMMAKQGHGTVIFSAFASAKFALRGLVQSVAREYQNQGVHIAHVILDGILDTKASRALHSIDPSDMMATDDVAEVYLQIIQQKPSAWVHELDLRPKNESF